MLRLTTTGRRTGQERSAILGYVEDGPNLILLAMNGWADPDPAWLLNLKAHPAAKVDLVEGPRAVIARLAAGDERSGLWERWDAHGENLASYAGLRSRDTQVVILEPPPT
jgi:deazaflavin-dependent oxidoreductase (nitroreductase family)